MRQIGSRPLTLCDHVMRVCSFVKQRKRVEQLAMFGLDESGKANRPLGGKVDDISVVVARIE